MMLSVVIAAYNEEKNIGELTSRLIKILDSNRVPFEILYVIAGQDKTIEIVKEYCRTEKRIRFFYSPYPSGLGNAFKKGFLCISENATHVLTMDADLNHQPEELPLFFDAMKKINADVIVGSRYVPGGSINTFPYHKRIISKFTNFFVALITGIRTKDKTSNYRLYARRSIDCIAKKMYFPGFECVIEMLLIAVKHNFRIVEVPIQFKWRIHGKSKLKLAKAGIGYLKLFSAYFL